MNDLIAQAAVPPSITLSNLCKCGCGQRLTPRFGRFSQYIFNHEKRKFPHTHDIHSRLYRIWRCIHFRCYQKSHKAWERYGGRGITVCDQWSSDYGAFMRWALSNGYADDLTIDRIDNDLGYFPENCRWVTMTQQQRNRRDHIAPITAFGETKKMVQWAEDPRCIVTYKCLRRRILTGCDPEWSITTRIRATSRRKPMTEETKAKIRAHAMGYAREHGPDGRFLKEKKQ